MPVKIPVTMTQEQMLNVAERIERVAKSLRALDAAMEAQGFKELNVAHHDLMIRSLAGLESYDKAAWEAHHQKREQLSHYGDKNGGARKKTRRKKPQ